MRSLYIIQPAVQYVDKPNKGKNLSRRIELRMSTQTATAGVLKDSQALHPKPYLVGQLVHLHEVEVKRHFLDRVVAR